MTRAAPREVVPSAGGVRPGPPPGLVGVLLLAAALGALTVLVAIGATTQLDNWVKELFRPHDEWGDLQVRVDAVVEGLRPGNTLAVLAAVATVVSLVRRSWWPLVCTAGVVAAGVVLTAGLKAAVARPDTHGVVESWRGSYPSGHVAMVLLLGGCTVMLLQRRPGAFAWSLVTLAGAVMAWALLVETAHWFTDVVGGVLVAATVLTAGRHLPFTRAGGDPRGGRPDGGRAGPPTRHPSDRPPPARPG